MERQESSSQPLVTVVTVTFNLVKQGREALFRRCVESVRSQTYGAIEHLVIDGASADGTRDLIREYEAAGCLTCLSEPDKGIYDAMNKGIRLAKGKYIAFLNSDDSWHDPRGVEWSVRCLERAEGDFSYAPYMGYRVNAGKTDYCLPELGGFCSGMPICHQTMFTRTEALRAAGGFAAGEFRMAADYDMVLQLLVKGCKPVFVPLNFTTFRRDGLSGQWAALSAQETRKARERWLQPLVPEPVADTVSACYLPHTLYLALGSLLHPAAMQALADAHGPADADGLHPLLQAERVLHTQHTDRGGKTTRAGKKYTGLLGIPLLSIRYTASGIRCFRLFGCLPLWGVRRDVAKQRTVGYLFGLLPVYRMVRRHSGTCKCSLLGLPIWGAHQGK